jgi:hypothetical protein
VCSGCWRWRANPSIRGCRLELMVFRRANETRMNPLRTPKQFKQDQQEASTTEPSPDIWWS